LKKELEKTAPALQAARKLIHLSRGRFPKSDSGENRDSSFQEVRRVATLLHLDSILRAQDNQTDEALVTAMGILNAGRSIGDEPKALSQLVRMSCEWLAISQIERVLSQGEASDKSLQSVQLLLQDEASQPLLLFGVRGDRAHTFEEMGSAKQPFVQTAMLRGLFRLQTECVEAAKAPPEEQLSRLQEIKAEASNLDVMSGLWLPSHERMVRAFLRNQAWMRCSYVAVAVERFRRSHGRWPDSLAALVPEFLQELPADPYNGLPLKFRRLADGVVIYSVGPDQKDDGGKLDRKNPTASGTDLGFQLWDVAHRRQPWRPPPNVREAADED
jgi:hypothetical protein